MRALVLALVCVACGPRVRPEYIVPSDEDDPLAMPSAPAEQAAAAPAPAPAPPPASAPAAPVEVVATGSIPRVQLAGVLDAGPAAFFQAIAIEPSFADRRFQGWEIRRMAADAPYARADLAAGDVVTRVNGKTLERPEAFQDMWESLRFASELVVEYRRQGQTRELRFAITE